MSITMAIREKMANFLYPEGEEKRNLLEREANTCPLTGLANFRAFNFLLSQVENNPNKAIVVFDADNFGFINKIKNQLEGDELIKKIGECFRDCASKTSEYFSTSVNAFRLGGDEFAVFIDKRFAQVFISLVENEFGYLEYLGVHPETQQYMKITVSISGAMGDNYLEASENLIPVKQKHKIKPQIL